MKATIEEVSLQVKEVLDLDATYLQGNRALLVSTNKDDRIASMVFWWTPSTPGVFDTDELEETAAIDGLDGRLHTHSIEVFDVETMEEFLEKVKQVLSL